ncbi:MAG: valine--tRNA ligase [Armatimonadota bacterium]|nr:MAG: valine--tRNA ligase [Armatimonadota bacterium]
MDASELSKTYEPHAVEQKWYDFWNRADHFHAEGDASKPRFCITIPPPNVTGSLHMGHALQHAIHDLLARWQRMLGKETLILPGTDHAGIPTQMKVEAELAAEGTSRHALGREEFLERMWQWREKYGGTILKQLRALGCSYDWRRERFTLDDGYYRAVLTAFVHFYQRGWIYRGERVVNWCPACNTTVSDLEVEHREVDGKLWHIRYPAADGSSFVVVATTRPETMLGDTAVGVHPDDARYRALRGKTFILPLMNREIPLVEDAVLVDPEFGSGAVKITPAHDPNDFDAGQRNGLPSVTVIGKDARMTEDAGKYAGLDRYEAREAVLRDLEAQGLLIETEQYHYSIGHHDKCATAIEPLLSEQWFLAMRELADMAKKSLQAGGVEYVPDRFLGYTLDWLDNLRDWNISRQIWWGHRLPVWFCEECDALTVQVDPPDHCGACGTRKIEQAPDVLDTWFSSALWPFATLGWPEATPEMECFYPTDLLITGRDILYLWVVRMVMTSLEFTGKVPFYRVLVHPTILNWEGRRMSKSLGTGVDPMDLISTYGADATRFGLIVQCSSGQDVRFTEERIEMSRNFANKIWNAARLVRMNLDDAAYARAGRTWPDPEQLASAGGLPERWILSRLEATTTTVTQALTEYRVDEAARALYDFFWGELCDWYLEIAKPALHGDDAEAQALTRDVIIYAFERTLRLLHPFMPFITEELWQALPHSGASIMIAPWPESNAALRDAQAEAAMTLVMDVVTSARRLRAEQGVQPAATVDVILTPERQAAAGTLAAAGEVVAHLVRAKSVSVESGAPQSDAATDVVVWEGGQVRVAVAAAVSAAELEKERDRLQKELAKLESEMNRVRGKLKNANFLKRAPAQVVADTRARAEESERHAAALRERVEALAARLGE